MVMYRKLPAHHRIEQNPDRHPLENPFGRFELFLSLCADSKVIGKNGQQFVQRFRHMPDGQAPTRFLFVKIKHCNEWLKGVRMEVHLSRRPHGHPEMFEHRPAVQAARHRP